MSLSSGQRLAYSTSGHASAGIRSIGGNARNTCFPITASSITSPLHAPVDDRPAEQHRSVSCRHAFANAHPVHNRARCLSSIDAKVGYLARSHFTANLSCLKLIEAGSKVDPARSDGWFVDRIRLIPVVPVGSALPAPIDNDVLFMLPSLVWPSFHILTLRIRRIALRELGLERATQLVESHSRDSRDRAGETSIEALLGGARSGRWGPMCWAVLCVSQPQQAQVKTSAAAPQHEMRYIRWGHSLRLRQHGWARRSGADPIDIGWEPAFVSVCDAEDGCELTSSGRSRSHLPEGICMSSGISSSETVGESAGHWVTSMAAFSTQSGSVLGKTHQSSDNEFTET
ncbi:hypothetical protein BC826DRAFT_971840 [Russula brevipes]|nr:hypothetical protein BC826DRAFT_971840 [Russula brevipes]